ncbi:hypothetical protein BKA59DRAFT_17470 [Fusarium tricinctum]|uniref:Zinc-binding loop region of homing endonuclease domain-containing protein n=1 Tax=Fusarium tricinctum TaxID=61284 RepID=A0A8K0S7K7_9HYPO|nr:hypothetical protein BKA59DRAFT_17470 [Fusarium tricinctum]
MNQFARERSGSFAEPAGDHGIDNDTDASLPAGPKASAKRKLHIGSSRNSGLRTSPGTVMDSRASSMRPSQNPSPLNDDGNGPTFDLDSEDEDELETSAQRAERLKRERRREQAVARKAIAKEINDRAEAAEREDGESEDETPAQRAKRLARGKIRLQAVRRKKVIGRDEAAASAASFPRLYLKAGQGRSGPRDRFRAEDDVVQSDDDLASSSDDDVVMLNSGVTRGRLVHRAAIKKRLGTPEMVKWSEEVKVLEPSWLGNNNKAHIITFLKNLYDANEERFYKVVCEVKAELMMKFDAYQTVNLSAWITHEFGEDVCFSGVYWAFPNANLTEGIQIVLNWTGSRSHWAMYPCVDVNLGRLKNAGRGDMRKKFWLTADHNPRDFLNLLTGDCEISHRCDWRRCMNPSHLTVEHHNTNVNRGVCFRRAISNAEHSRIQRLCKEHDPPCLLQQAALPIPSRLLLEYEHLGHELPDTILPTQTQSDKGPIVLNSGVSLWRWDKNRRILDRHYPMPVVGQVFAVTPAPNLIYSGHNFTNAVRALPEMDG